MFERIMVALKPWERGLPLAASHARQLAQSCARVELVSSVFDSSIDASIAAGRERGDRTPSRAQERAVSAARVELERLAASMREWGGARVATRAIWGAPAYEAILAAASEWRADLLVIGAHDRATLQPRLTDTDWQLLRRTRCPLLLVKSGAFTGYRTIVAAVGRLPALDESAQLDRAVLSAGRSFARAFGSTLRAVYAHRAQRWAPGQGAVDELDGNARRSQDLGELAGEYGVGAAEIDLAEGSPADAIVGVAAHRRADLVVAGLPRRSGVAAQFVGYTAEQVAGSLPCDLLIVPAASAQPAADGLRSKVG